MDDVDAAAGDAAVGRKRLCGVAAAAAQGEFVGPGDAGDDGELMPARESAELLAVEGRAVGLPGIGEEVGDGEDAHQAALFSGTGLRRSRGERISTVSCGLGRAAAGFCVDKIRSPISAIETPPKNMRPQISIIARSKRESEWSLDSAVSCHGPMSRQSSTKPPLKNAGG